MTGAGPCLRRDAAALLRCAGDPDRLRRWPDIGRRLYVDAVEQSLPTSAKSLAKSLEPLFFPPRHEQRRRTAPAIAARAAARLERVTAGGSAGASSLVV